MWSSGNPLLDGIVLVIVLPFVLWGMWWTAQKARGEAEKAKAPVLPTWPEIWEEQEKQRKEIERLSRESMTQATTSADQERELQQQRDKLDHVSKEVDRLKHREGVLARWILRIRAGIQKGTIPPYPVEPHTLVQILSEIENEV